jgi:uncharacterized protein (TIGR02598 family)
MNLPANPLMCLRRRVSCGVSRGLLGGFGGFTLVEVTLAIGVISFAFVATIGLLPVGLSVSRQAIETTIQSQIVQQLTTQALQTDFSQLGKLSAADPYYFDDQGKTATAAGSIYKAGFTVATTTALPDPASNKSTQKLATVTIFVLNTKGIAARAAADLATAAGAKKFTILIPDNGL